MKVVCFTPDTIDVADGTSAKNIFFLEMTSDEFEKEVRPLMEPYLLPLMQYLRDSDVSDKVYVFLTLAYNRATEKYDIAVWPSFQAWSGSGMNYYTRVFLHKDIVGIPDILKFYIGR